MQIPGKFDVYNLAVLVHITAAMLGVGVVLAWPLVLKLAGQSATTSTGTYALGQRLHQQLVTPAMVVVLGAGIYLTSSRWKFSTTWINLSMTLLLILTLTVLKPGS